MEVPTVTEADLAATMFPFVKERVRTTTVPPAPQNLRAKHGPVSGQVICTCQIDMENIRVLEVQWTLDPVAGPWIEAASSTKARGFAVDGLPRGKDVWIRVRARNVIGLGEWSDPFTIMVM